MKVASKNEYKADLASVAGGSPVLPGPLALGALFDAELRTSLIGHLAVISNDLYQLERDTFISSLPLLDRQVYLKAIETPYATKDWWRDAHDIYVTWSLGAILKEENARLSAEGGELLPDWLVTAALLHDRGYAVLAGGGDSRAMQYGQSSGAHWENVSVRQEHALLSRRYAEDLFADPESALSRKVVPADREIFLSVIERHDYPLIGMYDQLPEIGRHHFDADSLYSLSLISFVKDYLSYLGDPRKFETLQKSELCSGGPVLPSALLAVRMDRYFSSPEQLPVGWDVNRFPLIKGAAAYGEGSKTMEPVSETARALTAEHFIALSECCRVLERTDSVEQFLPWLTEACECQFRNLSARVVS